MNRLCAIVALMLVFPGVAWAADTFKVTVDGGNLERRHSIVTFAVPAGIRGDLVLRDEQGRTLAGFARPDGTALFIIDSLPAGQSRTFTAQVGAAPVDAATGLGLKSENDVVQFFSGKNPILTYQGAKSALPQGYDPAFARGGYIHLVHSPSGKVITDDYPPRHKHHHGIWAPWTKTEFEGRKPDFWNMGAKTGTVEFVKLGPVWAAPVVAGLTAKHRQVDLSAKPEPKVALNEQWDLRVYPAGKTSDGRPYFIFDLTITQEAASQSPLILPKYHYGGLGVRGHREWEDDPKAKVKNKTVFLTSEGKTRENGNETTGKWAHMGGMIDGKPTGIAVLCHPENFRFPQPLRLHPDEPFMCYAPSQGGDWKIEPGKPYVAKYRFVTMDGEADAKVIEQLWNDYARPVQATVQ